MNPRTLIWIFAGLVGLLAIGFVVVWYMLSTDQLTGSENTESSYFDFLGFGGDTTIPEPEEIIETPDIPALPQGKAPLLRKLSSVPVSAAIATTTRDGLFVRYIERGTGNVYDIDPDTGDKTRLSQTTIPRIQEAFWMPNALNAVVRYFDSDFEYAETFAGGLIRDTRAATGSPLYAFDGEFLETDIKTTSVSAVDQRIAYLAENANGSTLFTTRSDGSQKTQIYSSPVREWLLQWFKGDTIALTTKASSAAPGFLYFIPSRGGQPERILPGTFGLTTLVSPSGDRILFSETAQSGLILKNYTRSSRTETMIPAATLPEKCVWSKTEPTFTYCGVPQSIQTKELPDLWYMGLTSFSDQIWKIDTTTGSATLIAIPKEYTREEIDAVQLSLSRNEDYLIFVNKKDGSLWALELQ